MNKTVAYFLNIYPKLSETFVQREIDNLRKLGYDVQIFAIRRKIAFKESFKVVNADENVFYAFPENTIKGILFNFYYLTKSPLRYLKCTKMVLSCFRNSSIPSVAKQFSLLFISAIFLQKVKRKNIKHIHAHFSHACSIAMFCHIIEPEIKFSFTAHASADIYFNAILLKEKIQYSNYIITISNYNKRYLNLISGYSYDNKIYVVHNGVVIHDTCNLKEKRDNITNLISVADFTYCKGHATLLEALSIVNNKGYSFNLKLIGSGDQEAFIRKFVHTLKLSEKVKFLGALNNSDVLKYMAGCDIFILPSEVYLNGKRDGIPTVCIEAMSLRIPVITTYISGIPELIENGETGLLVPERNPEELSKAIIRLIENPELRGQIAEKGFDFVKDKFNIETTIKDIDKIFSTEYLNEK